MKTKIKALIFDFGNVIIDIDINKTYEAFASYCNTNVENIRKKITESDVFRRFEIGLFDEEEFREIMRQTLGYPLNDSEIDKAWNALLLDLPFERIELINKLKNNYKVYLLSNTNTMHISECRKRIAKQNNLKNFFDIFDKAFFSYDLGLWKPDPKIYFKVLDEIGLKPDEVLFLDDNIENIEAAKKIGLNTQLITPEKGILEVFQNN